MSTLQEQIEARKELAWERQIEAKAQAVAKTFGRRQEVDWWDMTDTFVNARFTITSRSHRSDEGMSWTEETVVKHDGMVVFEKYGHGIRLFIPGAWEEELEAMHREIPVKAAKDAAEHDERMAAEHAAYEIAERKKWGL